MTRAYDASAAGKSFNVSGKASHPGNRWLVACASIFDRDDAATETTGVRQCLRTCGNSLARTADTLVGVSKALRVRGVRSTQCDGGHRLDGLTTVLEVMRGLMERSGMAPIGDTGAEPGDAALSDIRQLTGRAAFRLLLMRYRAMANQAGTEMRLLANDVNAAALPATLQVRTMRLASGALRLRLFWRVRGDARVASFERVRQFMEGTPPSVIHYVEKCQARALELNATEAIFRYAATQLESFLDRGSVRPVEDVGLARSTKRVRGPV